MRWKLWASLVLQRQSCNRLARVFIFHFDEKSVQLLHLSDTFLVLTALVGLNWCLSCLNNFFSLVPYIFYCIRINVVSHRRWIKLLQSIFYFFFFGKFQKVFKSRPLFILLINRLLLLLTIINVAKCMLISLFSWSISRQEGFMNACRHFLITAGCPRQIRHLATIGVLSRHRCRAGLGRILFLTTLLKMFTL